MALDLDDIKRRMQGAIASLKSDLASLRTGRASASMVEPIVVDAYGANMPLNQVATISVPEARMITVQVWDRGMASAVERAIRESNLGLNPIVEGTSFRIPIPELTAERRKDLAKVAHKYAEQARIAVRNVRRDGMDALKKLEKDGEVTQDEQHSQGDRVQKFTDQTIAEIDQLLAHKEQEIQQV